MKSLSVTIIAMLIVTLSAYVQTPEETKIREEKCSRDPLTGYPEPLVGTYSEKLAKYYASKSVELQLPDDAVSNITAYDYSHAFVNEKEPNRQDCKYHPAEGNLQLIFDTDKLKDGVVKSGGVIMKLHTTNVPPAGIKYEHFAQSLPPPCRGSARGNTCVDIEPGDEESQDVILGNIALYGYASSITEIRNPPGPKRSIAYASSMGYLHIQGVNALGNGFVKIKENNFRTSDFLRDITSTSVKKYKKEFVTDPIWFSIIDTITSDTTTGILYSSSFEVSGDNNSDSSFWENNIVRIEGDTAEFIVEFPTAYTSVQGKLHLKITNGIVSHSSDTGIYENVLPPVGTPVPIIFELEDSILIEYDISSLLDSRDSGYQKVSLNVDGIGGAIVELENDEPLPVLLTSFFSDIKERDVRLTWTTSSEKNNSGFEIERCNVNEAAGENFVWTKIGFVKGHGTISFSNNYVFDDKNLSSGKFRYRLKQTDFNGNFQYYELQNEVNIGTPQRFSLGQNYPNPFNPVTKINYDIPQDGNVMIKIYDNSGREVMTLMDEFKTAGYWTAVFNGSSLSSGIYFYRIVSGLFEDVKKMVLLK